MKKFKLLNILFYCILIISFFAYEVHIYEYYNYVQMILFTLLCSSAILMFRNREYRVKIIKEMKKNLIVPTLCILMIVVTLCSILKFPELQIEVVFIVILYTINIFLNFFCFPIYLKDNKEFSNNFVRVYIVLSIIISLFGIVLYFNNGMFGYKLEGGRSGSIYFDSNFFAIITVLPSALIFRKIDDERKFRKTLIFIIAILSILVSGSRGTLLSFILCIIYFIFMKYPNQKGVKKIFLMSISVISAIIFMVNVDKITFLRLDQGSHGRLEMIIYSVKKLKESPVIGFGYGSIEKTLRQGHFANTNTHNSLIEFAFRYGYVTLGMYIIVILMSFYKAFIKKEKLYISLMLILLLINMNTILYSFGGVGLPSMALTLCMGLACYGGEKENE